MNDLNDKPVLKLSPFAAYVISCDQRAFGSDSETVSTSKLINRIILNYSDESHIVRDTVDDITEVELAALLKRLRVTLTKSMLVNFKSSAPYNTERYRYPQNSTELRISLTKESQDKLYDYMYEEAYEPLRQIYSKGGKLSSAIFISALVEEYTRLPMFRRESIFYSHIIKKISDAIRINNDGETCYLRIDTKKKKNIRIYPVEILLDEWSTYNYLVGIGVFDPANGEMPISIRISNITNVESSISDKILVFHNQPLIDELYDRIKKRGVMFMGSPYTEGEKIRIRLSPAGFGIYNNVMFLRPRYVSDTISENGDHIMEFNCTEFQIKNYFRRLGCEAEVLEPLSLREDFAAFFRSADKIYDE